MDRYRKPDPQWEGEWDHALRNGDDQWIAEIAVPLQTLTDAGLNAKSLQLNCMSRSLTRHGLEAVFLTDPVYGADFRRCIRFRRLIDPPATAPEERTLTVRLHFAETDDDEPKQRLFDVSIQGKKVLEGFNVAGTASERQTVTVREFRGVRAGAQIEIELASSDGRATVPPAVCGIEIVDERTR